MFSTGFAFLKPQEGAAPAPPSFQFLLDSISYSTSDFFHYYSLKKLRTAYSGSAIQVLRASDNATLDIGFVSNELDTAAITTFCTGTTGFVSIWYDQGGGISNNNYTTPGAPYRPYIYANGAIVTGKNGKPAVFIDQTNYPGSYFQLTSSNFLEYPDQYGMTAVWQVVNTLNSNAGVFAPQNTYSTGLEMLNHNVIGVPTLARPENSDKTNATSVLWFDNDYTFTEWYSSSGNPNTAYKNGISVTLSSTSFTSPAFVGPYALGTYAGGATGNSTKMLVQEFGIYPQNLASQRATMESITQGYWEPTYDRTATLPTISGLKSHHKADAGLTVTSNRVSAWADQSGNGWNLTNGGNAGRSAYYDRVSQNGIVVVDNVNTTGVYLQTSGGFTLDPTAGATMFAVVRGYGANNYFRIIESNNQQGLMIAQGGSATELGGGFLTNNSPYGSYVGGCANENFYTVRVVGSTGGVGVGQSTTTINGATGGTPYTSTAPGYTPNPLTFFANYQGNIGNSSAIAEFITYSRVLTASEITSVEQYLRDKWKHY
jgi:hypothetical protein